MLSKKIIIIGFGNMGLSHLKSLIKLNYEIFIVDKNKKKILIKLKFNKIYSKNGLKILNRIPKNINFDLCIISTKSINRFDVFREFLKSNKSKIILLEKFSFLKVANFKYAEKVFDSKKIYINTWAYYLTKYISFKKKTNFKVNINVRNQLCLTNITHFLHFFFNLDGYSNIISKNKKIKIIKLKKDKKYNEIKGHFSLKTLNGNSLKIKTFKNLRFLFYFSLISQYDNYKIYFTIDDKIIIKKNNYKKNLTFPFSSRYTKKVLKKNAHKYFPNLEKDKILSTFLLKFINNRII